MYFIMLLILIVLSCGLKDDLDRAQRDLDRCLTHEEVTNEDEH